MTTEPVIIAMAGLFEAHGKLAAGEFQAALDAATATLAQLNITDSTVATAAASLEAIAFDAAYNLGDFALAFTHAAREVEHAERAELPETLAKALNNRAVARMEIGEIAAAEADLQEALRLLERTDDRMENLRPLILSHLDQIALLRGNDRWGGSAEQGLILNEALHSNVEATALARRGDYAGAIRILEHALAAPGRMRTRDHGILLSNLAELHARSDHLDEAIRIYSQACEVLDEKGCEEPRATTFFNLGLLQQQRKERERATECFKQAWDLIRGVALHTPKALMILAALGRARFLTHDRRRARSAFLRALELYEEVRPKVAVDELGQSGMFRVYRQVAELLLVLSLHEGWTDEVVQVIERAKARYWIESLARAGGDSATPASGDLTGLPEQSSVLGINGVAFQFFVGENATFVAMLHNHRISVVRVDETEEELGEKVDDMLEELFASGGHRLPDSADALARLLFGRFSLEPGVAVRHLFFLPDGPLWRVPFDALPFRTEDRLEGDAPAACDVAPTTIAPSLSILYNLAHRRDAARSMRDWRLALIGHPKFNPALELDPLPGTLKEMLAIAAIAAPHCRSTLLTDGEATKANTLELAKASTHIHLATHADRGEVPFLALAGDDRLDITDLAGVRLDVDLAMVAACWGSYGNVSLGEGMVSLARGFLFAGCRCVISPLWPLPDAETAQMTARFYERLFAGDSIAAALRRARISMRDDGATAWTWAAFQAVGDSEPYELKISPKEISLDSRPSPQS